MKSGRGKSDTVAKRVKGVQVNAKRSKKISVYSRRLD